MDMKFCKWVSKGPCESMSHPFHFIKGLIVQTLFGSPSINHIYSCSLCLDASSDTGPWSPGDMLHPLTSQRALNLRNCSVSPSPTRYIVVPYYKMHPMTPVIGSHVVYPTPLVHIRLKISGIVQNSAPNPYDKTHPVTQTCGSLGVCPTPSVHLSLDISEAVQNPTSKPYILFIMLRHIQ